VIGPGRRGILPRLDRQMVRAHLVDVNDGVIATAGVVEGLLAAGASVTTIVVAALGAMVGGGVALGGMKYTEAADERDAELAVLAGTKDALLHHAEVEHGITLTDDSPAPVGTTVLAGLGFMVGAAVPLVVSALAPAAWRIPLTVLAVVAALCLTATLVARLGGMRVGRTVLRTVAIGVLTMLLTLAGARCSISDVDGRAQPWASTSPMGPATSGSDR